MVDPDLQIKGGRGNHPDSKVTEGAISKKIFSVLRASFWSKNNGGGGPPGPLP